jgi:hypothetical protein
MPAKKTDANPSILHDVVFCLGTPAPIVQNLTVSCHLMTISGKFFQQRGLKKGCTLQYCITSACNNYFFHLRCKMPATLNQKLVDFLNSHERCSHTTEISDQEIKSVPCDISFNITDELCYRKTNNHMSTQGHKSECGRTLSNYILWLQFSQ